MRVAAGVAPTVVRGRSFRLSHLRLLGQEGEGVVPQDHLHPNLPNHPNLGVVPPGVH